MANKNIIDLINRLASVKADASSVYTTEEVDSLTNANKELIEANATDLSNYLRLSGGNVTGNLTVQNKNVVRSVNDIEANANGNVFMPFAPDYTSAIEGITFPYTAPQDGIISLIVTTDNGNAYFALSVDDVTVISYDTLDVNDLSRETFIIPIKKGSVAKLIGSGGTISFENKFIPYGE